MAAYFGVLSGGSAAIGCQLLALRFQRQMLRYVSNRDAFVTLRRPHILCSPVRWLWRSYISKLLLCELRRRASLRAQAQAAGGEYDCAAQQPEPHGSSLGQPQQQWTVDRWLST